MIDVDRKLGPMRLRAWGLVVNLAANAVALYGLSRVLAGEGGWGPLIAGGVLTVGCIAFCAAPSKQDSSE